MSDTGEKNMSVSDDIEQIRRADQAARDNPPPDLISRLRAAGQDERLASGALYLEAADVLEQADLVLAAASKQCHRDGILLKQREAWVNQRDEETKDLAWHVGDLRARLRDERKTWKKTIADLTKRAELAERRRDILIDQFARRVRPKGKSTPKKKRA
jgi:hypothetical protein